MKILVSALEHSSNAYLKILSTHLDGVSFSGIFDFGDKRGEFVPSDFAVMGFVDVLSKLKLVKESQKKMCELAKECDCVLVSDSASYNLGLIKKIKKLYPQKKVYYYILPQVWAWKKWRAKNVDRFSDRVFATIPFELEYYNKAEYVGHPLLDIVPSIASMEGEKTAFLPGSRVSEIGALMPIFRDVAKRLGKKSVVIIPPYLRGKEREIYGDLSGFELAYSMKEGLEGVSFAYVCSGSATLEVALYGIPLVLAYKAKKLDFLIVRSLVKLEFVGLANIFCQKAGLGAMHPEVLQEEVNEDRLSTLFDEIDRGEFAKKSLFLREYLKGGSAKNVADAIKKDMEWM